MVLVMYVTFLVAVFGHCYRFKILGSSSKAWKLSWRLEFPGSSSQSYGSSQSKIECLSSFCTIFDEIREREAARPGTLVGLSLLSYMQTLNSQIRTVHVPTIIRHCRWNMRTRGRKLVKWDSKMHKGLCVVDRITRRDAFFCLFCFFHKLKKKSSDFWK